jgi:hypothetical protein
MTILRFSYDASGMADAAAEDASAQLLFTRAGDQQEAIPLKSCLLCVPRSRFAKRDGTQA